MKTVRRVGASLAALAMLGTAVVIAVLYPAVAHGWNPHAVTGSMGDFALNVYYPSKAFLDGGNPYDQSSYLSGYPVDIPFPPYMPVMLLLHLPFAWLSFH